jgi:hypothetical protein
MLLGKRKPDAVADWANNVVTSWTPPFSSRKTGVTPNGRAGRPPGSASDRQWTVMVSVPEPTALL